MNIEKSSLYLAKKGIFEDDTKNASSRRVIKVPDAAIKSFRRLRLWQAEQRLALGNQWTECGNVFTSRTGSPMHPDTLSNWFHRFISKTDLPQIHLHCLRHTAASLYIANGVPITAVAANLGHANASTTAKIYAHSIQSAQAAAADLMDDLLSGNPQKKQCG